MKLIICLDLNGSILYRSVWEVEYVQDVHRKDKSTQRNSSDFNANFHHFTLCHLECILFSGVFFFFYIFLCTMWHILMVSPFLSLFHWVCLYFRAAEADKHFLWNFNRDNMKWEKQQKKMATSIEHGGACLSVMKYHRQQSTTSIHPTSFCRRIRTIHIHSA